MELLQQPPKYTYAEYLSWPENERWEIIEGTPYMQAAPSWQHQSISGELHRQFSNYLVGKECRVFAAPFDVCISEHNEDNDSITNVIQPDITVVCDGTKLQKTGYFGVPSLIIEITSPSTAKLDRVLKFNKYEQAGVKEYWIVDPEGKYVSVFTLQENNRYGRPDAFTEEDQVKVSIFADLQIDLGAAFGKI